MRSLPAIIVSIGWQLVACGGADAPEAPDAADAADGADADNDDEPVADAFGGDAAPADRVLVEGTTVTLVDDGDGIITLEAAIRMPDHGVLDCGGLELRPAVPPLSVGAMKASDPEVAV